MFHVNQANFFSGGGQQSLPVKCKKTFWDAELNRLSRLSTRVVLYAYFLFGDGDFMLYFATQIVQKSDYKTEVK